MTEEPTENISGGDDGGGRDAEFTTGDPDTRAEAVVDALGGRYWRKAYGGADGFECLIRTILSQNTSDKASQPVHDSLMVRYGPADDLSESLADADRDDLAETIASAGLYNRNSEVIVGVARRTVDEFGSTAAFDEYVADGDPNDVRATLLTLDGVGPKTVDCVLLFAGVFPVDTHVHRIARRMGLADPDADHETVRYAIESDVPPEKCDFGHTAMIQFGREYCTARAPACLEGPEACPMCDRCDRVGIDEVEGTVVDPADVMVD